MNLDEVKAMGDKYADLRAAAERATPGPRFPDEFDPSDKETYVSSHTRALFAVMHDDVTDEESAQAEGDVAFIAAADPTTILGLLEEMERLQRENAELRETLEDERLEAKEERP